MLISGINNYYFKNIPHILGFVTKCLQKEEPNDHGQIFVFIVDLNFKECSLIIFMITRLSKS